MPFERFFSPWDTAPLNTCLIVTFGFTFSNDYKTKLLEELNHNETILKKINDCLKLFDEKLDFNKRSYPSYIKGQLNELVEISTPNNDELAELVNTYNYSLEIYKEWANILVDYPQMDSYKFKNSLYTGYITSYSLIQLCKSNILLVINLKDLHSVLKLIQPIYCGMQKANININSIN